MKHLNIRYYSKDEELFYPLNEWCGITLKTINPHSFFRSFYDVKWNVWTKFNPNKDQYKKINPDGWIG